jgi:hypothetical protein
MRTYKLARKRILLALLLLSTAITGHTQQHNHGYIRFCNDGDTDLMFSLVSREGMGILRDSWRAHGVYPVKRQSCEYFAEDVSVAVQMFVGIRRIERSGINPDILPGVSSSGGDVRRVDEVFCTKREAFDRTASRDGHAQCPRGYSLQPFKIAIALPTLINFTLRVRDPGRERPVEPQQPKAQQPERRPETQPQQGTDSVKKQKDQQDVEARRAAHKAEAIRMKEAEEVFNQAYRTWYPKANAKMKLCEENGVVDWSCGGVLRELMNRMGVECIPGRDMKKKLDCFNKINNETNIMLSKWAGESVVVMEPVTFDFSTSNEKNEEVKNPEVNQNASQSVTPGKETTSPYIPTWLGSEANQPPVSTPDEQTQTNQNTVTESAIDSEFSSINFSFPDFASDLRAGRHDLVQIEGTAGFAYAYGVFTRGFGRCPQLKTTSISIERIYTVVEKKFWLDVVGFDNKVGNFEDAFKPVILTTQWMSHVGGGVSDVDKVIARFECDSPRTRKMVGGAEKLTVRLLHTDIGPDGIEKYSRPISLAGLPEETQQLYDEYHFCKIKTGQTDHLGSFGPCDEALFKFQASEAKATGMPAPARDPKSFWRSSKGPIGQYKKRSYGTDFIFYEGPANFTPELPDPKEFKPPISIKLKYNAGKRNRLIRVGLRRFGPGGVYGKSYVYYQGSAGTIVSQDYTKLSNAGNDTLLLCDYYDSDRAVAEIAYWYKTRPQAADPVYLRSRMRNHPALLVMDPRVECPPVLTTETMRKRDALLRGMQ